MVSQFSTVNSGINKRNFETSKNKGGRGWNTAHFSSSIQRKNPSLGRNFCQVKKPEFWDAQKRLPGSLNKFSTPVSSSFCRKGPQGVGSDVLERQIEWGHPLVWLVRELDNSLFLLTELLLEIPSHPMSPTSPCPPPLILPEPLPNANLSHGPGLC